jgi:hypothetical protein
VITAALVAAGLVLTLFVVDVAQVVQARARVTTAADAAALAAAPMTFARFGSAGSPVAEARAMAAANGAELIECVCAIDRSWSRREVVVIVGVAVDLLLLGDRRLAATTAAEFRPTQLVSP